MCEVSGRRDEDPHDGQSGYAPTSGSNCRPSGPAARESGGALMTDSAGLEWTSHPWSEDKPSRRAFLVVMLVAASAAAAAAFDSVLTGVLSGGILLASLSRHVVPTRYAIDPDGVRVTHLGITRTFPWTRFRRVALRADGVFLGTFDTARRLDTWRGCYLRCPNRRNEVHAFARARIMVEPGAAGDRPRSGDAASAGDERRG